MRLVGVGIFFLCLLYSGWCVRKAAQHRKDPTVRFYLGNVDQTGRKYLWRGLLALLASFIVWIVINNY